MAMHIFRRKDLADVEALLRDQGVSVDRTFIRAKLIELVGHARVDRWQAELARSEADRDERPRRPGFR